MHTTFKDIDTIRYEGPESQNPLSYRYYDENRHVLGKSMRDHLRLAVCYWHNFCWQGDDNFGQATFLRPWAKADTPMDNARLKLDAAFELFSKLNVPFFTFHDRDLAPEGSSLQETQANLATMVELVQAKMQESHIQLLWGTANLFSHPRYMAGAATNPDPEVFAFAAHQVKQALDATHCLGGANYVLWGGREGYDTLLNTDMQQECDQLAKFLHLIVDYKHKIGFKGSLLIEPKPCEPMKHQYDFDTATVFGFLQKYGLENEFKVNIEANHATLAGHSFQHEIATAYATNLFGSIDANRGDPQLGWDTDQFPIDIAELTMVLYLMLQHGGFTSGGFNFDTKLRRQSTDLADMFYAHISGIDSLARALLNAEKLVNDGHLAQTIAQRYHAWQGELGQAIMQNKLDLSSLAEQVTAKTIDPKPCSGQQEKLELYFNTII